jgi:Ca2+-dependent lipid-binding protein
MEMFGKQDPYAKISILADTVETRTDNNAGATPQWNQTFSFDLDGRTPSFHLQVLDEDVSKDDEIGTATVRLLDLFTGAPEAEVFVPITQASSGEFRGEIGVRACVCVCKGVGICMRVRVCVCVCVCVCICVYVF